MVPRTPTAICVTATSVVLVLALYLLLFELRPVFWPRKQRIPDERALTEDVAVELTRKALESDGYDTTVLAPLQHRDGRTFIQGHDEDRGYVQWIFDSDVQPDRRRAFLVAIEKHGVEYRCRVYRSK